MSDFNPTPGLYCRTGQIIYNDDDIAIAAVTRWIDKADDTAELFATSPELLAIVQLLADAAEPEKDRNLHEAWSQARGLLQRLRCPFGVD